MSPKARYCERDLRVGERHSFVGPAGWENFRDGGLPSFLATFCSTSPPDIARLEAGKSNPTALWGGLLKKKKIKSLE